MNLAVEMQLLSFSFVSKIHIFIYFAEVAKIMQYSKMGKQKHF